ncbi:MAG: hypothetical protein AB8D78_11840 [Akkermansiaceae bacterium]
MIRYITILSMGFASLPLIAEDEKLDTAAKLEKHATGSERLADEQDELSADVQQLVIEQTAAKVIDLLSEVEGIMDETTDYLADQDTGGITIAAQTEIIEKIYEAAKAKQQSSPSEGEAGGAMMDMMERMMGKKPGEGKGKGKGQGEGEGEGEGEQGGQGQTGDSNAANSDNNGGLREDTEERRIPKAAGTAGRGLPSEFQKALDAYNRGLEGLEK